MPDKSIAEMKAEKIQRITGKPSPADERRARTEALAQRISGEPVIPDDVEIAFARERLMGAGMTREQADATIALNRGE